MKGKKLCGGSEKIYFSPKFFVFRKKKKIFFVKRRDNISVLSIAMISANPLIDMLCLVGALLF